MLRRIGVIGAPSECTSALRSVLIDGSEEIMPRATAARRAKPLKKTAEACCDGNDQDQSVDTMFRAFSDRTRLRILHLLLRGEMCVCDLVTILETNQPRASQHLAYLRNAGLVSVRKSGLWDYYSLAAAQAAFLKNLLKFLEPLEAIANRAEVGQRASQPAIVHIRHAAALRFALDRGGRRTLRANEQHQAVARSELGQVLLGPQQTANCLADVDNVDEVAAGVNVRPHLRIPATRPVPEMDTCLDQVFHKRG